MKPLAAIMTAFFIVASSALAQGVCGDGRELVERLAKYGETLRGYGVDYLGRHVQLFVSNTGSWSITFRAPNQMTCMLHWGQEWHIFGPAFPEASHGGQADE